MAHSHLGLVYLNWTELAEAENCELFGTPLKAMSKDELMVRLMNAYKQIDNQREQHCNEYIERND